MTKQKAPFGQELKKLLEEKKLVLGTDRTVKLLKRGGLKKVVVSKNCPEQVLKVLERYTSISGVELQKVGYTNERLGTLCKKPFLISVIGVLK